jgi:beta-1,4-mannosyl-glycoprotein beta-1,4-N-acetylglucosaminyltransferase
MAVWDAFPFFNELEILEIRLHELAPVVKGFILVESTHTHTGKSKPLYFQENKERFKDYNIHAYTVPMPYVGDPDHDQIWENENYQRNALLAGPYRSPDDIMMISDLDEIPSREIVPLLTPEPGKVDHRWSYYYLNMTLTHTNPFTYGTVFADARTVEKVTPQWLRMCQFSPEMPIFKGGWHLTYMGGPDRIKTKIEAFGHSEFNSAYWKNKKRIKQHMKEGKDLYDRDGMDFSLIPLDDSFPHICRETDFLERYPELIYHG